MSNVLIEHKRQQVIALGRLGWPLRRIEQETGVRRETASAYLKAAGIGVRPPGVWGRRPAGKPANEVTTGSNANPLDLTNNPNPDLGERLSEGGRNWRATAGCVGTATCGKTGQRGDHRVQRKPTGSYEQPQPRKPSY